VYVQGSFFLGEELSMVDLAFVPFLERMVSSLLYYKGFTIRGKGMFPGIDEWFQALEQRPSYLASRSDHYTHCHDLPPQLGGTYAGLCIILSGSQEGYNEDTSLAQNVL
jgi:glutathione S-transferase